MASPTRNTTENPERPRAKGSTYSKGTLAAAMDDTKAAYSDERPSRGPWLSETPPTGVLTGVLGELSYYGACWLHYRSAQRRGKTQ
jgi:hypothetical protein